jgi:hypothetical protein
MNQITRIKIVNGTYNWYDGGIIEVWPVDDKTLADWKDVKSVVQRNGVMTQPKMIYLTMVDNSQGTIFYKIYPEDVIDIIESRENLINEIIH